MVKRAKEPSEGGAGVARGFPQRGQSPHRNGIVA